MARFTSRIRPVSFIDKVAGTLGFGDRDDRDENLDDWLERTLKRALGVDTIERDDDGDIPITCGSAVVFIRAFDNDPPHIEVFAPLLEDFAVKPEVYEAVNAINRNTPLAKAIVNDDASQIVLSAEIFILDNLSPDQLVATIELVADRADHYDTLLQKRFGGETMLVDDDDEFDV